MKNQEWDNTIRKLFNEVYSHGNINAMDQFFDPNVQLNDPAAPQFKGGLSELKAMEKEYEQAFPGKAINIREILHDDNRAIVLWECKGTQKGHFQGIRPTNKKVSVRGISIYTFNEQGKIKEITQSWDRLGLYEQIGEFQPAALHAR